MAGGEGSTNARTHASKLAKAGTGQGKGRERVEGMDRVKGRRGRGGDWEKRRQNCKGCGLWLWRKEGSVWRWGWALGRG